MPLSPAEDMDMGKATVRAFDECESSKPHFTKC